MKCTTISIVTFLFCQSILLDGILGEDAVDVKTKIDASWLQTNIASLGPSIPDNIVELHARIKPLLQDGIAPELIEIGKMKADKWHYVVIRFVNMYAKPIRIADVASSCGCLVAGNAQEFIESKTEGFVIGIVKPQQQQGVYRKSLTVTFDNGLVWPIMLSGVFETEFQFDQDTVKIDPLTQEVALTLGRKFGNRDLASLKLESRSGYLMVRRTECIGTDQVRVTFSVPIETKRSPVAVSERVLARERINGDRICEMAIGIDIASGIQCRPRRVLLKRTGDYFSGTLYLVGNLASSADNSKCVVGSNTGIPVELSTSSLGRSGAEIMVKVRCENVPSTKEEVKQVNVIVNDQLVCEDLKFSFFEE